MAQEYLNSHLKGISHSVGREMAGSSHTLTCCLSKPRSNLEAGRKQLRVWLQYVCSVLEESLYSSFGLLMVLLKSARYIHGLYTDYVRKIMESVSTSIKSLKTRLAKEDFYWVEYESIEDPVYKFERILNDF